MIFRTMTIRDIMNVINSHVAIIVERENNTGYMVANCYNWTSNIMEWMEELDEELERSIRAERLTAEEADNILDAEIVSLEADEDRLDIVVRF